MKFSGVMFEWRGPAPFYFVAVPDAEAAQIKASAALLTYGWGVIPVSGTIGRTSFTTSLIPKDGGYLVPIKNAVRLPEALEVGQEFDITLNLSI
ncbi:MAG: hypothetical protein RL556_404 [Actinomycetota bacterium]|jgi:hypothetical protein